MHVQSTGLALQRFSPHRFIQLIIAFVLAAVALPAWADNLIFVGGTCTLAQAIALANHANFVEPASIGSATTSYGSCQTIPPPPPPSLLPPPGPYNLIVMQPQSTLASIDNYWYGPNALPPIASTITITGSGSGTTLIASHTGDPTPATANAFRFFYVSGGMEIPAGSLTLQNVVLQGGYAKGGDSTYGGGGAGMGGAIFNQGGLALNNVSLIGNTAQGGNINSSLNSSSGGGGGMGQDGGSTSGGGFGGVLGDSYGGGGGSGSASYMSSGGGGGFIVGSSGGAATTSNGAPGGGKGSLGGAGAAGGSGSGGAAGDGGGGGGGSVYGFGSGGGFGGGGGGGGVDGGDGGGGGVGGGGGGGSTSGGGGGGFGGGGGGGVGVGGFGGGGGGGGGGGFGGGFGGGYDASSHPTGAAGIGGAIFNHAGMVSLRNVTASGNVANGGAGYLFCSIPCGGSGLGAVLFNLNGNVTIDFSTLAGNSLNGNNGRGDNSGPEDATVYSLAYGNNIQDGAASAAALTIRNSIIHGTHADGGAGNDVLVNVVDGTQPNASSVIYKGKNFVEFSTNLGSVTQTGSSPTQADPLLGPMNIYNASPLALPVIPIGSDSPAYNTASSCLEADNSTTLATDERGAARPYGAQCDVGAYEFDGDYIFANGFDARL